MSRFRLILMGLLAVFAVSAVASASASAGPLHWYSKNGGLITGELLINALGGTQLLKSESGGVKVEITCSHLDVHGTLTNPGGTNAGTALLSLLYLACAVGQTTLKKCVIPEEMIHTEVMGVLQGTNTAPTIEFLPPSGATFVEITFANCENTGFNRAFPVIGTALGKIDNSTSVLLVNEPKAGSMLKFGGEPASLLGESTVEMFGGGGIEAKE